MNKAKSFEKKKAESTTRQTVRFGISADAHLLGRKVPEHEAYFKHFLDSMRVWKPDFVMDLGDFACQIEYGQTTPAMHDGQLEGLMHHWAVFSEVPCPKYIVLGNHDVGWIKGGDEIIEVEDLYAAFHGGEDITKDELIAYTKIPHRYYSFDVKGYHFIVLDGNNPRGETALPAGRDGVAGGYWIDEPQKIWLAADMAAHREKIKVVFSHEELHHTSVKGSGEGGDVPFPPVGKEGTYVDNGWELREMFSEDGHVLVCFFGHKHRNRWTVYGGVHYITLAALHWEGSYANVTISDKLYVEGLGNQRDYVIPFSKEWKGE